MSKKMKPRQPSEFPVPDGEPEVRPDKPGEPLFPDPKPEVPPENTPEEPQHVPPEIPSPEKEIK